MKNLLFPIKERAILTHQTEPEFRWIINHQDYYSSTKYLIDLQVLKNVKEVLRGRRTKSIPSRSSVYFTKSVTFSRLRFREWAKDKGIKIVRNPEKADVIIVDLSCYNNILKKREIARTFTGYMGLKSGIFLLETSYRSVPFEDEYKHKMIGENSWIIDSSLVKQEEVNAMNQLKILPHLSGKILSYKDLKKNIFDDNLDGDTLDWIVDMLKSTEDDNNDLAVEMLGNFSFINNEHVITDIFIKHYLAIQNSSLWKSVKFAHLRDKFELFLQANNECRYGLEFEKKFLFFKKLGILHLLSREETEAGIETLLQYQLNLFEGPINRLLGGNSVKLRELKVEVKRNDIKENYSFEVGND